MSVVLVMHATVLMVYPDRQSRAGHQWRRAVNEAKREEMYEKLGNMLIHDLDHEYVLTRLDFSLLNSSA